MEEEEEEAGEGGEGGRKEYIYIHHIHKGGCKCVLSYSLPRSSFGRTSEEKACLMLLLLFLLSGGRKVAGKSKAAVVGCTQVCAVNLQREKLAVGKERLWGAWQL